MSDSNYETRCVFLEETDKAVRIQTADKKTLWIPKSQCSSITKFAPADGKVICEIVMTEWIAKQKGLLETDDDTQDDYNERFEDRRWRPRY